MHPAERTAVVLLAAHVQTTVAAPAASSQHVTSDAYTAQRHGRPLCICCLWLHRSRLTQEDDAMHEYSST